MGTNTKINTGALNTRSPELTMKIYAQNMVKVKVKQPHYKPGQALMVPGG
jgi:hypothetical protein